MRRFAPFTLVALLALALGACDSNEPDPVDPPVNAPTFAISSVPVVFTDGTPGLQFSATPNATVTLAEVVITNPRGQVERFNPGNNNFLSGVAIDLQDPTVGYTRVSGTWNFRFVGARNPAVTNGSFDTSVQLVVNA